MTKTGFNEAVSLKKIVDTATFHELGNTFYKDKNHIYRYYAMIGGGSFDVFDQVDYPTFEIIGNCYAKDKHHIYEMRSGIMKEADHATFISKKGLSGCIAKDKEGYFSWDDRISQKKIETDSTLTKMILDFEKLP